MPHQSVANQTNSAYDTGANSPKGVIVPAMRALKKLMQETPDAGEKRLMQIPAASMQATQESSVRDHVDKSDSLTTQVIETRFGTVAFNIVQPILFARGLLGMPDAQRFALSDFPSPRFAQFKLLQSLDDIGLSFITMPLDLQPGLIAPEDLQRACADVGMRSDDLAVLLMVTVHRGMDKITLSANLRAPLLIDAGQRHAVQYVFPHDRYSVQQPLNGEIARG